MKKKQRENHKKTVKKFMAEKREYNKNHPDEYEIKKLKHEGEGKVRLKVREKRRIKKWKKNKERQLKNALRDKIINEVDYKKAMEELKKI